MQPLEYRSVNRRDEALVDSADRNPDHNSHQQAAQRTTPSIIKKQRALRSSAHPSAPVWAACWQWRMRGSLHEGRPAGAHSGGGGGWQRRRPRD